MEPPPEYQDDKLGDMIDKLREAAIMGDDSDEDKLIIGLVGAMSYSGANK